MTTTLQDRYAAVYDTLRQAGQEHLLRFYDQLDDAGRTKLIQQIEGIDWPEVSRLIQSHVLNKPTFTAPGSITPAPALPAIPKPSLQPQYHEARKLGEKLISDGKVAAFCVAGGQGTRLGWEGPKGTFPASPVRKAPLFQIFAEYILKCQRKYGCVLPFYVMTSPINHADTAAFFDEHACFGLNPDDVMLFPQAMFPAVDMNTGKCLLADVDELALSPNGHGGSLKALWTSGAIDDMKKRGIEHLSYIQVDNPLVKVIDPLFLGLHAQAKAQMSSKSLTKRDPLEKVGNFAMVDGKMTVIEYTNMPDELAKQINGDGSLKFNAGSIAIHVIDVAFVEGLNTSKDGFALPWNRAEKKVPYLDPQSQKLVKPEKPNAIKLETFVFDALPFTQKSIVLETLREDEFGPIKNADAPGAQDSPQTSAALQSQRGIRWLRKAGVEIAHGATVELTHTTAIDPEDLHGMSLPKSVPADKPTVL